MKKNFEEPRLDIFMLEAVDIITTSGDNYKNEDENTPESEEVKIP